MSSAESYPSDEPVLNVSEEDEAKADFAVSVNNEGKEVTPAEEAVKKACEKKTSTEMTGEREQEYADSMGREKEEATKDEAARVDNDVEKNPDGKTPDVPPPPSITNERCSIPCLVHDSPKTVLEREIGEIQVSLNDWGEITISNMYSATSFVLPPRATKAFVDAIAELQKRKDEDSNTSCLIRFLEQLGDGAVQSYQFVQDPREKQVVRIIGIRVEFSHAVYVTDKEQAKAEVIRGENVPEPKEPEMDKPPFARDEHVPLDIPRTGNES